jgi:hypothetical protein
MLVEQAGGDVVVAVGEDGGSDVYGIAKDAAGGVTATIDLGLDVFDDDALAAFYGFHSFSSPFHLHVHVGEINSQLFPSLEGCGCSIDCFMHLTEGALWHSCGEMQGVRRMVVGNGRVHMRGTMRVHGTR